ncbi:MAG: bifunctional [glutamate--ammonia ligase]-adenylyl-L-tyrosine phosphorylase/[glutamate--ammonia-ligase] adenylyltransferase, partial [Gammaproteobacteria bacterium]|nr:bifunctional [glutamate--ammonia ligase]-adenylyl-L-tyrosine phosphorylase/[glutamate--ammonia-ligase] adenylyltransferase [Gammaproteobacteria bacterium]
QAGIARLQATSQYAGDILARYPDLLPGLAASGRLGRPCPVAEFRELLAAACRSDSAGALPEDEFLRRLRHFRHRELLRIIWRDQNGGADLTESLEALSGLADAAINAALDYATDRLAGRHGLPRGEDGQACGFGVVALGKLGGPVLNFSSDVDLVFVYSGPGETDGARALSNEEYFRLLSQRLIDLLSRKTADGFVYRVDVRLRPFGTAGPLAVSLPALENYLVQHGRDWERYAWLKARVVNDWCDASTLYDEVLRPFVYRRYLDYGVFSSLRDMKALIEAEVARREFQHNLKLGPGGIREIEFIVQALQLVRGGTVASLRERQLLRALPALVSAGCLSRADADELAAAYRYLRLTENRLQAISDRQTHDLPDPSADRQRLTRAMDEPDWASFAARCQAQRDIVARHFRQVVFREASPVPGPGDDQSGASAPAAALRAVWLTPTAPEAQLPRLAAAGFALPGEALERVERLRAGGLPERLDEHGRQRLDALVPAVLAAAARQPEPLRALDGMILVLESIGRRSAYFALLNENPPALERLVGICAASEFLARLVATHPLLLDELIDPRVFEQAPTRDELARDLAARLARAPVDDIEARLDALRNFQQAATFRVAIADLTGGLPIMKVSDRLTDIAELVLAAALDLAWRELATRHGNPCCVMDSVRRPARFAIVAYGKLGGLELGYGSDLDLVFIHDSGGEQQQTDGESPLENAVFFSRLTRRIISILTMHTTSGKLYEVDIRLRPDGQSGLLVSSLAAFDRYQREQAWTWEHQALLRSRAVAGDPGVQAGFEALRVHALTHYVRREKLREEVAGMRTRMREELSRGTTELMDLKQDPGGVADIEFLVQYLALREAPNYPDLLRWSDNIRQLEALAAHGVLGDGAAAGLADAYRSYRQRLHHLSLAGAPPMAPREEVAPLVAAVTGQWREVFYNGGPTTAA